MSISPFKTKNKKLIVLSNPTKNKNKIPFTKTLRIMNITTKCIQLQTNQPNSMGLQKHINMKILMKSTYNL